MIDANWEATTTAQIARMQAQVDGLRGKNISRESGIMKAMDAQTVLYNMNPIIGITYPEKGFVFLRDQVDRDGWDSVIAMYAIVRNHLAELEKLSCVVK